MSDGKNKKWNFPTYGGSSVLVIFTVLCLVIFAILSISTVSKNENLTGATVNSVTDYYAADAEAEVILAKIREGEVPDGVVQSGEIYSYVCTISDSLELACVVKVSGTDFEILKWQAMPAQSWTPEDDFNVWDGEGIPDAQF